MDATYPLYPILTFIFFLAILVPLPAHLQAKNVGTSCFIVWTSLGLINQFVNSIVWRNNALNLSPGWCDFSSHLTAALSIAIPSCSLAISRRLHVISRMDGVSTTERQRKIYLLIDLGICIVFPIFSLLLYFFVQGHRFDIIEELGCIPVVFNTPLAYFLVWMWPTVLATASLMLGVLTSMTLLRHRREIISFKSSSSSTFGKRNFGGLSSGQFTRLLALASVDSLFTLPLSIATIVINLVESPMSPWRGLADAHFDFSRVDQIPAVEWKLNGIVTASFLCDRIFILLCAGVFVCFFSFAEESRKWWFEQVLRPCGKYLGLSLGRERWNKGDFSLPMTDFPKGLVVSVDVSVKRDTFSFGFGRKHGVSSSKKPSIPGNHLSSFWEEDERKPSMNIFDKRTEPLPLLPY